MSNSSLSFVYVAMLVFACFLQVEAQQSGWYFNDVCASYNSADFIIQCSDGCTAVEWSITDTHTPVFSASGSSALADCTANRVYFYSDDSCQTELYWYSGTPSCSMIPWFGSVTLNGMYVQYYGTMQTCGVDDSCAAPQTCCSDDGNYCCNPGKICNMGSCAVPDCGSSLYCGDGDQCCSDNGYYCCDSQSQYCNGGSCGSNDCTTINCGDGYQCCADNGNYCCQDTYQYCNGGTCGNNNCGTVACSAGDQCCNDNGDYCCDSQSQYCNGGSCGNNNCNSLNCGEGTICCADNGNYCCDGDSQYCNNGTCANNNCNTTNCDVLDICCTDNGNYCCGNGTVCSGGTCAAPSGTCGASYNGTWYDFGAIPTAYFSLSIYNASSGANQGPYNISVNLCVTAQSDVCGTNSGSFNIDDGVNCLVSFAPNGWTSWDANSFGTNLNDITSVYGGAWLDLGLQCGSTFPLSVTLDPNVEYFDGQWSFAMNVGSIVACT